MPLRFRRKSSRLALAGLLIAVVALIDWRVEADIAFGFLYLFPMLLVGTVAPRPYVLLTAALCTFLADRLSPAHFIASISVPHDILVFSALAGAGLFSYEVARGRRIERENLKRLEKEVSARRETEEQLEFLIENSPVAIVTMTSDFEILRANSAAHRLLGVPGGELPGKNIRRYIPTLGHVPLVGNASAFKTEMQCHGVREQGEMFLANVFFSTYSTALGSRMAALVVDASEGLREQEELSLEQVMSASRILVGAVSHEVRNVCSAISVIYENLVRSARLNGNQDFEALGSLVETLNKIASVQLTESARDSQAGPVDLAATLADFRIVLDHYCREADMALRWNTRKDIPLVWADRHMLLQVLLNLIKNSERALQGSTTRRLEISVSRTGNIVSIRVTDSGPGIASPEHLFEPFRGNSESTGLGLYLSRAFMRSFHGDLRHDPQVRGCSFVIDLVTADSLESAPETNRE